MTVKAELWDGDDCCGDLPVLSGSVSEDEAAAPRRVVTIMVPGGNEDPT